MFCCSYLLWVNVFNLLSVEKYLSTGRLLNGFLFHHIQVVSLPALNLRHAALLPQVFLLPRILK